MNGQLRFEVLGPVRAWRGDEELELGAPQQRAILGILLLRGGMPASPDQLIAAVWGPTAPRAAVGMVRSYVSRLRRVLDQGQASVTSSVIESVGGGYALRAGSLDLTDFGHQLALAREARRAGDAAAAAAALRTALDLWRGTPLAGVNGDYAEFERTRLVQLRLTAVEDLAAADLDSGRHVEAAAELADVIADQPLRERPRELLMLALYRAGRQADALGVFADIARLLADELGLDPGPDLREMQRRILASDPALFAPAAPAPATPGRRPTQLPPDLPDFVGRGDLVGQIDTALTGTGVPVVGIEGLAGAGKTTLATHVGHMVAARFPDGQLFVDLGVPGEPISALLRGIGVPDSGLPESFSERVALWRTLTTGRRLLVVLDDARDAEQVRPLLPGSGGAAVVVTSRRRLYGLSAARWVLVGGLSEDAAVMLLSRLIGADRVRAEEPAARVLLATTAGLPQVIHAVGARLAARPEWTIAVARERLGPPGPGALVQPPECGAIERPYESALSELSPAQARAFRLLAVPDGPDISLAAAAVALDLSMGETAILLESLVDVHLLEVRGLDRYFFHGPVHAFARGRALADDGPDVTQALLTRLVRFYSAETGGVRAGA